MNLKDIKDHMVDLRRSEYDAERSDPSNGQYVWKKRVYLKSDDYKDDNSRPDFKYYWVAFDEDDDFRNFNKWRMHWDAVPVRWDDKLTEVYPEPLVPTTEGYYRYMDMILMRIPVLVWVQKREGDVNQYDKARQGLDKKFKSEAKAEGAEVEGDVLR